MNVALAAIISASMLVIYGALVVRRFRGWRTYHDNRARRELGASVALFLIAVATALTSALSISQTGDIGIRRALAGIAFSAYLAAGVLFLMDEDQR